MRLLFCFLFSMCIFSFQSCMFHFYYKITTANILVSLSINQFCSFLLSLLLFSLLLHHNFMFSTLHKTSPTTLNVRMQDWNNGKKLQLWHIWKREQKLAFKKTAIVIKIQNQAKNAKNAKIAFFLVCQKNCQLFLGFNHFVCQHF